MTLQVQSATVHDDALVVKLVDGDREFSMLLEGAVRASFTVSGTGVSSVAFSCVPRTTESTPKHLNGPPVDF